MQLFLLSVLLFVSVLDLSLAKTGKEEMELSADDTSKLDILKSGLDPKAKDHPHLGNEVVLKQFLISSGMDVNKAKKGLEAACKFDEARNTGKDAATDANFPEWKKKIGGITDAVDKEGRVILYLKVNKWEWSQAIFKLEMEQWKNTFYRLMDEAAKKTLDKFAADGKNVRFFVIADYISWDPIKGLCGLCTTEIAEIARRFESRWPNMKSHVVIVMTPDAWKAILDIIKPIFSKETNEALKVHGMDKTKWWPKLQKDISDEELKKMPFDETV